MFTRGQQCLPALFVLPSTNKCAHPSLGSRGHLLEAEAGHCQINIVGGWQILNQRNMKVYSSKVKCAHGADELGGGRLSHTAGKWKLVWLSIYNGGYRWIWRNAGQVPGTQAPLSTPYLHSNHSNHRPAGHDYWLYTPQEQEDIFILADISCVKCSAVQYSTVQYVQCEGCQNARN